MRDSTNQLTADLIFTDDPVRPPYDAEIDPVITAMVGQAPPVRQETLEDLRRFGSAMNPTDLTAGGEAVVAPDAEVSRAARAALDGFIARALR